MATYVTADLHGYPAGDFDALLKKGGFTSGDDLFVLGDVIDRNGDGGVGLLRRLMCMPNAFFILGNHEKMMLDSEFVFKEITEENLCCIDASQMDAFSTWMANGGDVTLGALKIINKTDPGLISEIYSYLAEAPLYEVIDAGGREFLLVHAGLGGFSKDKKLSSYTPDELLWTRPALSDRYFENAVTVFGHTPTDFYGEEHSGRIIRTDTWINIDTGAAHGGKPTLLRLDDLKEFRL